ncbi:MAG: tetratricopeptide repeat protein [Pyrinomonadaceae bacterium]|nr:tetratricopeptide repeat protein [Pyrinomonadaceae bacterium]
MSKSISICLFFCLVFALSVVSFGQDLGSSNGLFRSPNPTSTKTTEKKSTPKPTAAKKETPKKETVKSTTARSAPRSNSSAKTSRAKTEVAKTFEKIEPAKIAVNKQQPNNIVINVGQPTTGNFDELYEKAIDEGNNARDDRNYSSAESAYRRAQSLKPKDSRAVYGLGNIYSDQQRWEEAEKYYRQAILLEPNSPEAHIALSFVLTQPVVGTDLSNRFTEAEKMARKALFLDPNNAVGYDQLGVALESRGLIEKETQESYRKAIQIDPNFALAYAHLGRLLRRNGLVNESSAAYKDAIRLSTDVPTMILVAEVMQTQQRFVESEQLLRRAISADPKNPTALFLLGRALTTRNSFAEAEQVLRTSVAVSPNSFVSYALLGSLYARQNNFTEAEKTLMEALKVVSLNERKRLSQEFEFVGDGLMKVGKTKDAVRVYRQAIALDGDKSLLTTKLNKAQKS